MNTRQQKITEALRGFSIPEPLDSDSGVWYCDQATPDYWRFGTAETEGARQDVFLDTEYTRSRIGVLYVRADVVRFDPQNFHELERRAVISQHFDGGQPREQAFLLNAPTYQQQINDSAVEFYEQAQYETTLTHQ